ncbi:hypothetical protein QQ045_000166 [Rhodiola kirilowii]
MEFWKPEAVKTEQSTAMQFFSYKVRKVVKLLEIISALILVFWSTTRLPIAVKLSIEFAKQLSALLLSTPSVFLIGNAIVLALVAQSGSFGSSAESKTDLYDEFVNESRLRTQIQTRELEITTPEKMSDLPEPVTAAAELSENDGVLGVSEVRCYRRTQSETVVRTDVKKELLRRTRTEKLKMKKKASPPCAAVDDLSGDEFRRTVEAFIAKQQRFLRDENMALVVSN